MKRGENLGGNVLVRFDRQALPERFFRPRTVVASQGPRTRRTHQRLDVA